MSTSHDQPISYREMMFETFRRSIDGRVDYHELYQELGIPLPTEREIEIATASGLRADLRRLTQIIGFRRYNRYQIVSAYLQAQAIAEGRAAAPAPSWRALQIQLMQRMQQDSETSIEQHMSALGIPLPTPQEIDWLEKTRRRPFLYGFLSGLDLASSLDTNARARERLVRYYMMYKKLEEMQLTDA